MTPSSPAGTTAAARRDLGTLALVLGVAGLLPLMPLVGSVAALVCGYAAPRGDSRARAGVLLGWLGVLAPVVVLTVYCVVLGYPFPIHRYHAG